MVWPYASRHAEKNAALLAAQCSAMNQLGAQGQRECVRKKKSAALMIMSVTRNFLLDFAAEWFAILGAGLRSVFTLPTVDEHDSGDLGQATDPDFEGWLHNDPMVTGNPASRYGDDAPGYVTGNGLGSLEIGASDD